MSQWDSIDESDFKRANILIVDDEKINIRFLTLLLEKAGYQSIISTTDPHQVCSLYQEWYPDVVLLDFNMPGLDGLQVMQQLKAIEQRSYLPVMMLTANTDNETRMTALNHGAKDFLLKPFNEFEVLIRIRNMLEVRLLHNKLRGYSDVLEAQVWERTEELRKSQLDVVRRLGKASEYRDCETGQHILRMSYYSQRLAQKVGIGKEECELILHASPMHDIGKIGIPDSILLKPGKLTVDEFEIMKTHTTIGAGLLDDSDAELIETARMIAITHHEKWNGSGYPNGLAGEEIPLFGRIVALCDVFDALTSERPYKKAWTVEHALDLIIKESGSHFDPNLVPQFQEIVPDILEIKARYGDVS